VAVREPATLEFEEEKTFEEERTFEDESIVTTPLHFQVPSGELPILPPEEDELEEFIEEASTAETPLTVGLGFTPLNDTIPGTGVREMACLPLRRELSWKHLIGPAVIALMVVAGIIGICLY
jgi:hypothetical protein